MILKFIKLVASEELEPFKTKLFYKTIVFLMYFKNTLLLNTKGLTQFQAVSSVSTSRRRASISTHLANSKMIERLRLKNDLCRTEEVQLVKPSLSRSTNIVTAQPTDGTPRHRHRHPKYRAGTEQCRARHQTNCLQTAMAAVLLLASASALLALAAAWLWDYAVVRLLWRPRSVAQMFRAQGVRGPPYRFLRGCNHDIRRMREEADGIRLDVRDHNYLPRVLPHLLTWKQQYGMSVSLSVQPLAQVSDLLLHV